MNFAAQLIDWHRRHGRHDLPWQADPTPYRVWISEIMLQQTQVATVIPYFERFLLRFGDVAALAAAPLDAVLHLWTGLGYYSRARNLHRAAGIILREHGGVVPQELAALQSLPGIGRSTAGAILSLALGQRQSILDGNVRRVLSRHFAVAGAAGTPAVERELWRIADQCTPAAGTAREDCARYSQAIMDLGATVCTRTRPRCGECPLAPTCLARASGQQSEYPGKRVRAARRQRQTVMLIAQREDGSVLLERRPERGIWGGLWCLPEFASADAAHAYARRALRRPQVVAGEHARLQHAFTHFDLEIIVLHARCGGLAEESAEVAEPDGRERLWFDPNAPQSIGMPAPVVALVSGISAAARLAASPPGARGAGLRAAC